MSKKGSSIVTLAGEFKNTVELKAFCDQLYTNFESLLKENESLKARLGAVTSLSIPPVEALSDEEAICLDQLDRLKRVAMSRDLSLDEVKKLDILHKNLRLIHGEATSNFGKTKDVTGSIPTQALIQIAAAHESSENK